MQMTDPAAGGAISANGNARPAPYSHRLNSNSFPALRRFVPPARVIDKPAYSAFTNSALASFLSDKGINTLVIRRIDVAVARGSLTSTDAWPHQKAQPSGRLRIKTRPRHQVHQHVDVAAIDRDLVAIDIGRAVAGQEQDGVGDVLRHADPP
jgi:hypothetical protein